jgi:hypothetical protein
MELQVERQILANDYGIVFDHDLDGYMPQARLLRNMSLAADAQPGLITISNGGIPAYLVNYLDPELIRVLVSPMMAAVIAGEAKKGDWTSATAQFPMAETVGEISSYDDYSNNGNANANYNWIPRQAYHFQTITQWGEKELALAAEARIDHAAQLNISSALILNKAHNYVGMLGVANLQCFGLLNDPALPTPISPAASGTGSGTEWSTKTGDEIYADIQSIYAQLVLQGNGTINKKMKMCLAMSNTSEANFTKTNTYGINLSDLVKKNFPNMRIETAVEYDTTSGQLVQMFVEEIDGIKSVQYGFTEKMRAHPVKTELSSWKQKKSAGTWGTIWKRPFACASMLGV